MIFFRITNKQRYTFLKNCLCTLVLEFHKDSEYTTNMFRHFYSHHGGVVGVKSHTQIMYTFISCILRNWWTQLLRDIYLCLRCFIVIDPCTPNSEQDKFSSGTKEVDDGPKSHDTRTMRPRQHLFPTCAFRSTLSGHRFVLLTVNSYGMQGFHLDLPLTTLHLLSSLSSFLSIPHQY